MVCNRCGNRSPLNSKFCRFCGSKLDEPGASKTLPEEEFYIPATTPIDHERVQRLLDEAFAQSEKGEVGSAIRACKEALVIDPRSVPVHSLLGLLYERVGEKEKAIAQYERVLQLNPDSALERESLARLRGEKELDATPATPPPAPRPFLYVDTMPIVAAAMLGILMILFAYYVTANIRRPARVDQTPQPNLNVTNYPPYSDARGPTFANHPMNVPMVTSMKPGQMGATTTQPTTTQMPQPATPPNLGGQRMTTPSGPGPLQPLLPPQPNQRGQSQPVPPSRPGGDLVAQVPPLPGLPGPGAMGVGGGRRWSVEAGPPSVRVEPSIPQPGGNVPAPAGNGNVPTPPNTGGANTGGVIQITKSDGSTVTQRPNAKPERTFESTGWDHQQQAMASYRNGDYEKALQEFQQAMAAYQEQQRKGINAEEAADGIQTCQRYAIFCQRKLAQQ